MTGLKIKSEHRSHNRFVVYSYCILCNCSSAIPRYKDTPEEALTVRFICMYCRKQKNIKLGYFEYLDQFDTTILISETGV